MKTGITSIKLHFNLFFFAIVGCGFGFTTGESKCSNKIETLRLLK